ncbi:c-type cytochrome [Erythrobacter sp.]|uniref:c-type cytochrome n=1 Tax=Erythrobacter sp. TaxID=1042 RepID=UPI001425C9B7|nr:c-type cytochrome [Erythrobacter sp.]QIQ87427.1 MAG: cytochrome c [Erythrobacter sp.]
MKRIALLAAAAPLAACQTPDKTTAEPAAGEPDPPAFVEAACGGCHAVEPPFLSPNPQSPTFEAIANRQGLSEDTLGDWLADAHNYPEMMDFDLTRAQVDQIAAYMVTLRREDYVPAP